MEYNDFSILPDEEYIKIKNNYLSNSTEPKDFIVEIYHKLFDCISICSGVDKNTNIIIRNEIDYIKNNLIDLCKDLSFSYKIKENLNHEIKNFNTFKLLENLTSIIVEIQKNNYISNKTFEKTLLTSIENKLTIFIYKLVSKLNQIEIHIFKHF